MPVGGVEADNSIKNTVSSVSSISSKQQRVSMAHSPSSYPSPAPMNNALNHQNNVEMDCLSLSSKMSSAEQIMSDNELMDDFSNQLSISPKSTSELKEDLNEKREMEKCLEMFEEWNIMRQTEFIEQIIDRMSFHQHEHFYSILLPMLQRDFITALPERGLSHVSYKILSYLDARSLCRAERVCQAWNQVIATGKIWKKLIETKVSTEPIWRGLVDRRGWGRHLFTLTPPPSDFEPHQYFRKLYPCIVKDIQVMEDNWRTGSHTLTRIQCHSENSKGVYCLQYDDEKIVSGLRDNTIKIWMRSDLSCFKTLTGHTGSVLCLQYDERVIVTGSSDSTIRVWDVHTGTMINTLVHHCEAVLHLRFNNDTMVTCSKDRTIAVWDINGVADITLRRVLVGHRAAVNVVDFDKRYIVSASGDRTIKVWKTSNSEFVRTLHGHRRGIACLQYRGNHVVSGSSDNTIRIWDVECGACLRLLEGHEELVRCIRFDDKRIVSGAYDGTIKVWDLKAALDPRTPATSLCQKTLTEHSGRVFRLQFDDFQIVSSSHDDTILIWDFMDPTAPDPNAMDVASPETETTPVGKHFPKRFSFGMKHPMQESLDQGIPSSPPYGMSDKRIDSPNA